MQHSEQMNELATALAKAQGKITGALKDSANPFFKSKYADLAACWDACRDALSENGLAVLQPSEVDDTGVSVTTLLVHSSGQWIQSTLKMVPKDGSPQSIGSAISYGRRYGLTAMIGIAQVDDDGNQASGRQNGAYAEPHTPQGDMAKAVPIDAARAAALEMIAIIDKPPADGDHDEMQKAMDALDYHYKINRDAALYVAASAEMNAAKRNVWKALVAKAQKAEKDDRASAPSAGRRF